MGNQDQVSTLWHAAANSLLRREVEDQQVVVTLPQDTLDDDTRSSAYACNLERQELVKCLCENHTHFDDYLSEDHKYGAEQPDVQPTELLGMGTWQLCKQCREVCQADRVVKHA